MVRPAPRRLHSPISQSPPGRASRHHKRTHLHRTRDIDVCPSDERLIGAFSGLDALDEGLEEERGGTAARSLATRLFNAYAVSIPTSERGGGDADVRCRGQRWTSRSAGRTPRRGACARSGRARGARRRGVRSRESPSSTIGHQFLRPCARHKRYVP